MPAAATQRAPAASPARLSGPEALDAAFNARSVAIIGASSNPAKLGNLLVKLMLQSGFPGRIHPINRSAAEVLGLPTWKRLLDVPEPVDVAVLMVPSDQIIAALEECAAKGVRVVAGMTSGFAEAGEAGSVLQEQLESALPSAPYRLLGPNCEGFVVPGRSSFVTFSAMTMGLKAGPVGIVAQSGAISGAISHRVNRMGVGIRALVTTGNESDILAADALEWFADDPETNTVVCYLEQIRDAGRFVAAARAMRGRKAIVVQKPGRGRASAEAVTTHTGAIAGDDRVADGVFEELQIVRVHDHGAAIDAAAALSLGRRLLGLRVGIVSIAGGLAVEASDLLEAAGFAVPPFSEAVQADIRKSLPYFAAVRNPVDLTGAALSSPDILRRVIDLVLAEGEVDALLVAITFSHQAAFADVLLQAAANTAKPLLVVWTAPETLTPEPLKVFSAASFPVFDAPARALTGLRAIARFSGLI